METLAKKFEKRVSEVTGYKFKRGANKAKFEEILEEFKSLKPTRKKIVLYSLNKFKTFTLSEIKDIVDFIKDYKGDLNILKESRRFVKAKPELAFQNFYYEKVGNKKFVVLEYKFWTKNYWRNTVAAYTVYAYDKKRKFFEEGFTYSFDEYIWASYQRNAENFKKRLERFLKCL